MELRPGYQQTEVGVIPEDWEARPLLTTVRIANGQVDPRVEPYRTMTLVAPDHIESETGRLLSRQSASDQRAISGKYLFGRGDIVYSKIRPYLRKAILADFDGLCSADMYPLKPAADVVGGFMLGVLLGHRFTKYAESVSVRSGMPKINRVELADFVVALPPALEQRAIAAALSDADALLGGLDRLLEKKRHLKQAAMQQLLTGETRLPEFNDEWVVKRLGDIAPLQRGFDLPNRDLRAGPYPVVYSNGVLKYHSHFQARGPGVVTGRSGTIGKVTFVEGPYWPHNTALWVTSFHGNVPRFIFYLYRRIDFARFASGSGVPTLNRNDVHSFEVRIPSNAEEQAAIAVILGDMDAELSALEARRDKTRALKQGMMQELLTGKTRLVSVGGADD